MADKFANGVDTPSVGADSFRHNQFVDDTDRWAALPGAAKTAAAVSGALVLNSVQNEFNADTQKTEDYYTSARKTKQALWDAAIKGDDDAVNQYSQKLQDLKIAEKQGLISGTNSSVRQESLLKSTINRFPHREEEIRRMYSSTRERAQLAREQLADDPVEKGIDALIQRSYAAGRNPAQQLDYEGALENIALQKAGFEQRVQLGQEITPQFNAMVDTHLTKVAYDAALQWLDMTSQKFKENPKMTIEEAKAGFEQLKGAIGMQYDKGVLDLMKNSPDPDAILPREAVLEKRRQIMTMLDGVGSKINSMDELDKKKRMLDYGKTLGLEKMVSYDAVVSWMVLNGGEAGAQFLWKDFTKTEDMIKVSGVEKFNQLIKQATGSERSRLTFQRDLITGWDGNSKSEYFDSVYNNGAPPASTGVPEVDAMRMRTVTSAALGSSNATPKMKSNAAIASVRAEKEYAKPGEYLGPSSINYKDPGLRKQLREDPKFQAVVDTEIDSASASILNKKLAPELLGSLSFVPQMESEDPSNPEGAYGPQGGPFSVAMPKGGNSLADGVLTIGLRGRNSSVDFSANQDEVTMKALNKMYWIKRAAYGAASAEDWATTILDKAQELHNENAESGPLASSTEDDGTPNYDYTD